DRGKTYTSREVADMLGFDRFSETNRYARVLESVGYVIRTNSMGRRLYTEKDIECIESIRKYASTQIRLGLLAKYVVDPALLTDGEFSDVKMSLEATYKIKDIADTLGIPFPNVVRYANYLEYEGYNVQRDSKGRRVYTDELVGLLMNMQRLHLTGVVVKKAAKLVMENYKEEGLDG
ncbi:hypothetical protein VJ282_33120, partial [Bacillus mycoides]